MGVTKIGRRLGVIDACDDPDAVRASFSWFVPGRTIAAFGALFFLLDMDLPNILSGVQFGPCRAGL